jgi:hypothetical protein
MRPVPLLRIISIRALPSLYILTPERNPGKMTFTTASGLLPAGTAVYVQRRPNGVHLETRYSVGLQGLTSKGRTSEPNRKRPSWEAGRWEGRPPIFAASERIRSYSMLVATMAPCVAISGLTTASGDVQLGRLRWIRIAAMEIRPMKPRLVVECNDCWVLGLDNVGPRNRLPVQYRAHAALKSRSRYPRRTWLRLR